MGQAISLTDENLAEFLAHSSSAWVIIVHGSDVELEGIDS